MKRVISCVLLMLVLTSNAFALEVPTDTVVQNLNGSQQAIKTFTVSPEQDPAALIEEPFELEGYLYTFADIVKSENPVEEKRIHTEVITVETTKDDLALILEQLKPTIEYDDGRFQGTPTRDVPIPFRSFLSLRPPMRSLISTIRRKRSWKRCMTAWN